MTLACPVCNAQSALESKHPEADIYRCAQCDHCFSDVTSVGEPERYRSDYYEKDHGNWFKNPNTRLFGRMYSIIAKLDQGISLVDVGCGKGDFLVYLRGKSKQLRLSGVDLSENAPVEGITFVQADFLSFNHSRQYDVVVSMAAIEHMTDIYQFTNKLRSLCKPDGLLFVMTLNDRSILYATARWLTRFGIYGPYNRLYSKHHLHHFNIQSLRFLLQKSGLTVVKILRHNIPLSAVDFPRTSRLADAVMKIGVAGAFLLGTLTGRTYLQTVMCRKQNVTEDAS